MFTLDAWIKGASEEYKVTQITADTVILALPNKAVEILYPSWLHEEKKNLETMFNICNAVVGVHCTKINLYFDRVGEVHKVIIKSESNSFSYLFK